MKIPYFSVLTLALVLTSVSAIPSASACDAHAAKGGAAGVAGKPELTLAQADGQKAVFQVKGMMCKSCEKKITTSLRSLKGVNTVSFGKKNAEGIRLAEVTYVAGSKVTPAELMKAVQDAGYEASAAQ